MKRRFVSRLAPAVAAVTLALNAGAEVRGMAAGGHPYVTGGITVAELLSLQQERDTYSLWLTTAAMRSGAHLSDVSVRILDERHRPLLDTTMVGPWLMVNLPLGRYTVETRFQDQVQTHVTQIHKGDHHQMVVYFDVPAEVSPDWVSPFGHSPYSGLDQSPM